MSLLDVVREVRRHLEENGRVSYRMLRREFELDDDAFEEVIEELVDIQQVAVREERALAWAGASASEATPPAPAGDGPSPRSERDPHAYTPQHLADKILQSRSALEGERKQVTVLFADVKGSMDLAEAVDAESLHRIMDRFFEILTDGVHRFEGTVNQYTGDGIMALFGAPIAHEDHAQRACLSALALRDGLRSFANELRRERGISFAARMGLHSGEVIVGKIGDDLRMDYTAQGQTVNLAARMEQIAEPGDVYLTERTAGLVQGYMELEDLGAARVKGSADPIGIFALRGVGDVRTRLDVSRSRGLTRFVGREEETAALETALERARTGQGQVVGVVAEAGTGKSRLCFEFLERARARGSTVNEGYAVPHGRSVPLLPIRQLYRMAFGISDQDSDQAAREKIAGRLLLRDDSLADVLPLLFELMNVPDPARPVPDMSPDERERTLGEMVHRLVAGRENTEPVIVLLEDLHWFDDQSDALLAHLVEALPGTRTLALVNFRPGYRADWMQRSYYQQLALQPLGPDDIRALLDDLLGTDPSLGDLAARLHDRSGGNPFFIEELVQALVERGDLEGDRGSYRLARAIDELQMPRTVQAVLAARIDRLPEREKHVLQSASVIGRTFGEPLLRTIAELPDADLAAALRALVAAEFVYEESLYPEVEYTFKHALTQDVAYGSQLADSRARLHAAVARSIEARDPERLDEHAALLAHHWEEAGDALVAARWHARAAGGESSEIQVARHWERACELLGTDPAPGEATALALRARGSLLVLGSRVGTSPERFEVQLSEARELAQRSGEVDGLLGVLVPAAYGLLLRGELDRQQTMLREVYALLEHSDNRGLELAAVFQDAVNAFSTRSIDACLPLFERCEELADGDLGLGSEYAGGNSPLISARAMRGTALAAQCRHEEALEHCTRAMQHARDARNPGALAAIAASAAFCASMSGRAEPILSWTREAHEAVEGSGALALVSSGLGTVLSMTGEHQQAVDVLERCLELVELSGLAVTRSMVCIGLARAYRGLGDFERSRRALDRARTDGSAQRSTYIDALIESGWLAAAEYGVEGVPDVRASIEHARGIVHESGFRAHGPLIDELEAEILRLQGDTAGWRTALERVRDEFEGTGATGHAARLARELAR